MRRSPVDNGTLLRAARDHLQTEPTFAREAATTALGWMALGRCYELKAGDAWRAMPCKRRRPSIAWSRQGAWIRTLIDGPTTDPFIREQLARCIASAPGRCRPPRAPDSGTSASAEWRDRHWGGRRERLEDAEAHIRFPWPGAVPRTSQDCAATRAVWRWRTELADQAVVEALQRGEEHRAETELACLGVEEYAPTRGK